MDTPKLITWEGWEKVRVKRMAASPKLMTGDMARQQHTLSSCVRVCDLAASDRCWARDEAASPGRSAVSLRGAMRLLL